MSEFKVGDEVWFFYTNKDSDFWGDYDASIFPKNVELTNGKIVWASGRSDAVHVYVNEKEHVARFGYTFFDEYCFGTKQDAIDAMIKRLDELREE